MTTKRLCKTNKEALRWCKSRGAVIEFGDWRKFIGMRHIPEGITCMVAITKLKKNEKVSYAPEDSISKTLLDAVNKWIKKINLKKK